jgi:hypothetical protein
MIGVIMLMGLVSKNAILLVDFTNTLRERGMNREDAIKEAGPTRLRPILMTTLAQIFGALPIALALGRGAEFRAPLGIVIIGGLLLSTLLTLLGHPVLLHRVRRHLQLLRPPPQAQQAMEEREPDAAGRDGHGGGTPAPLDGANGSSGNGKSATAQAAAAGGRVYPLPAENALTTAIGRLSTAVSRTRARDRRWRLCLPRPKRRKRYTENAALIRGPFAHTQGETKL